MLLTFKAIDLYYIAKASSFLQHPDMHVPTHIILTIISDHEVFLLCMSVLNCYSNFTAYTFLVNP